MAIQKFLGYAPDLDPTTPGVVTDCDMLEPSIRGLKGAPSAVSTEYTALAGECRGSALVKKLDGTKRLLAGTQTRIYEATGGSWVDRSETTVTAYAGSSESRWEFRQFGDVTIAQNGVDEPQESTASAFATVSTIPIAKLIETASGFLVCANVVDASYAFSDAWWCSALYDYTDFTPSIATQSARARLFDTPGPINALRALGGDLVAFKDRSMYFGRYVGPDVIWSWQLVPGNVGAYSQGSVVSDGTALYWWGGDDFYRFDGSRPQPIGSAVKKWFSRAVSQAYLYKMLGDYDRASGLIRWYYVPSGGTAVTDCVVLNTKTGQWGRADRTIEAVVEYVSSAITYDSAGVLSAITYDTTDWTQSFDSPFWLASSESPAIFNSSHVLQTLTGVSSSSSLTSGDFGDDDRYSLLRRVRPRYSTAPTTASMTNYYKTDAGDALTLGDTMDADDGKFDVLQSARWHRVKFDWTGAVEVSGMNADMQPEGEA